MMRVLGAGVLGCLVAACAGATRAGATREPAIGYDSTTAAEPPSAPRKTDDVVPEDVVARAVGPVSILRLPEKTPLETRAFLEEVLAADAICAGEEHASAPHHYGEVWLLDRLAEQAKYRGLELGVGLEMFQQLFQGALSAFQSGRLGEDALLGESEYEQRWGYPFAYYRPLLERAKRRGLPLIALNARTELTRTVAEKGIDALDAQKTYELPALKLDDPEHRADFDRRMQSHPAPEKGKGEHPSEWESGKPALTERYYQAQVVWDEAMAERAARWLTIHAPVRRMLIIAGQAHCQRSAIPARTGRRGAFQVKSVLLATPATDLSLAPGFDYALTVANPAP